MLFRIAADLVVVAHVLFIAFVAVGSTLVWKSPGLLWLHVPAVLWAAAIVMVGFTCPLTPLEKDLRERASTSSYDGGFVDHYLNGVVYPGRLTAFARLLVAVLIVVGYARLLARRRARGQFRAQPTTIRDKSLVIGSAAAGDHATPGAHRDPSHSRRTLC